MKSSVPSASYSHKVVSMSSQPFDVENAYVPASATVSSNTSASQPSCAAEIVTGRQSTVCADSISSFGSTSSSAPPGSHDRHSASSTAPSQSSSASEVQISSLG